MQKLLLYPSPLQPAFAYISDSAISGKPTVFIDAGIHGNELAPVEAVTSLLENLLSHTKFGVIVIPITNPVGYTNKTRYIDTNPNWQDNCHSVGDMGHLIGWQDSNAWHNPTGTPDNIYCKHLGEFALKICAQYNITLVLDLHEDDHPPIPPGGYIYPMNNPPQQATQLILDTYSSLNIPLLTNTQTRFFEPIIDGQIVIPPNGSFPELIIDRSKNCCGFTVETTQNQEFEKRVALHKAMLQNLQNIMNIVA